MNLLSNAIDACPPGGTVTVRTGAEDGQVRIDVIDNGHGINPAIRDRIFDPFFTTKPIGKGTGLGLSISYGIVQDHGGTIDVDSTPGEGSRFTVRLPLQPPVKSGSRGEAESSSRIERVIDAVDSSSAVHARASGHDPSLDSTAVGLGERHPRRLAGCLAATWSNTSRALRESCGPVPSFARSSR